MTYLKRNRHHHNVVENLNEYDQHSKMVHNCLRYPTVVLAKYSTFWVEVGWNLFHLNMGLAKMKRPLKERKTSSVASDNGLHFSRKDCHPDIDSLCMPVFCCQTPLEGCSLLSIYAALVLLVLWKVETLGGKGCYDNAVFRHYELFLIHIIIHVYICRVG